MLWCVHAVLFAATSVVVGVIWDISWHMTIGRDTFWTPAHLAIYTGGILAGVACGALILRTTLAGSEAERSAAVRVWGMHGPIGAWLCCWGAAAMITSGPLDDWWHNAYGLDVQILSPPHTLLALGIGTIAAGALMMATSFQNRAALRGDSGAERARFLPVYAGGLLIALVMIMTTEHTNPVQQHTALFYEIAAAVLPLYLVAMGRASRLRWGSTAAAAIYMAVMILQGWILPRFGGSPRLGPIYNPVTHMVPMGFPLLLIVPALGIDFVLQRAGEESADTPREPQAWLLAFVLAIVFLALFVAVQWPFSGFMISSRSHEWLFFGDNFPFRALATSFRRRGLFIPGSGVGLGRGMLVALLLGLLSSRCGLAFGGWLRRAQR